MALFKPLMPRLQRGHPLARGLVGAWEFTEGSGLTAYDSSGYGNHGTLGGSALPIWAGGRAGSALKFSTGNVDVTPGITPNNFPAGTIAAWILPTGLPAINNRAVRMGANSFWIGVDSAGNITSTVYDGSNKSVSSAGVNYLNATTHVAATADGVAETLYVNGKPAGAIAAGGINWFSSTVCRIGANATGSDAYNFVGSIDDVRLYTRALSAAEVALLYQMTGP